MAKKIAIVDDERDILDVLKKFLNRRDELDIDTFNDPAMALSSLTSGKYDLVLLDIMMPQMDGLEVLKRIKTRNSSVKVIMMTAYTTMDKTVTSNKLGADDYITKPFISLRDVENKVLDHLNL